MPTEEEIAAEAADKAASAEAVFGQSDEDFLKNNGEAPAAEPVVKEEPATEEVVVVDKEDEEDPVEKTTEEIEAEKLAVAEAAKVTPEPEVKDPDVDPKAVVDPKAPKVAEPKVEDEPVDPRIAIEENYNRIMKPFVANGKTITLKSPDEAIKLMQMGANYTKKMQGMAPHRAVLTMLEKNGLLDQGKLSFLIDLDKKNPDAIKKLVKDSGVDPLDFDPKSESTYTPGNHRVDAKEVAFNTALDDLKSTDAGMKTLLDINDKWDDASKAYLGDHPGIMTDIHEQRESGIYNRITDEMDRRKTLGELASDVSFLAAYELVGNELSKAGYFNDLIKPEPAKVTPEVVKPVPVAIRPAAIKPQVANNDKAKSASNNRTVPAAAKVFVNPLGESDEDFIKRTGGHF